MNQEPNLHEIPSQSPEIPYRFAFGPLTKENLPTLPDSVPLLLSIPVYLFSRRTDPDSLCKYVALTLKAICRPQAVATIARALQEHLQTPTANPTIKEENPMANHLKLKLGSPIIEQRIEPTPESTPQPEPTTGVSPTEASNPIQTPVVEIQTESQLSEISRLENLDPLSPNNPLGEEAPHD